MRRLLLVAIASGLAAVAFAGGAMGVAEERDLLLM
jgi:hypothetical protein